MKLSQLLMNVKTYTDFHDCEIHDIRNNSRMVEPGDIYVAIRGGTVDGHRFVPDALKNGAAIVIVDLDLGLPNQIIVDDTKKAYAVICANYFSRPSKQLNIIGITGTNGKTSVTVIIKSVLESAGFKTGLIGTIQIEYGNVIKENKNTTPDAYIFQKTLREMADAGCSYVVCEVSSHALAQDRVYGTEFAVCAFTNLTQDHLDYHRDMEDYFSSKKKLFSMGKQYVININDPYGKRLRQEVTDNCYTFSFSDKGADFYASDINCQPDGVQFRVTHNGVTSKVAFAIPGMYSVENALTALSICTVLGLSMDTIIKAFAAIKGINGRSEIIYSDDKFTVICDYAHTPDGIENILKSLKEVSKGRLVAVFGCGGDRDREKRPIMARACEKYADFIIVTSDNPRGEEPEEIIKEIIHGFSESAEFVKYTNRAEAIRYAMKNAADGDMIVLLGKGHETYQILKDETIHFDEREIVAEIAAGLHGNED